MFTRRILRLDYAVGLVWGAAPGRTAASGVLAVAQGLLPLLSLYLLKRIVDAVAAGIEGGGPWQPALGLVGLAAAVAMVVAALRALGDLVSATQGQIVTDHVQERIHQHSVGLDLAFYDKAAGHDALHRAQQQAPHRPVRIVRGLFQLAQNGVLLAGLALLLLRFHPAALAALALATAPGVLLRLAAARRGFRWEQEHTADERRAHYFHWILVGEPHAREVRLFDAGRHFIGRFQALRGTLREGRLGLARARASAELAGQGIALLAVYGCYAFLVLRTLGGALSVGDMVMYGAAFLRAQAGFQQFMQGLAGLYEDNLFLSSFHEFLQARPALVDPPAPLPVPGPMREGLRFEAVRFTYPGVDRRALDGVDLSVESGRTVAFVGPNGSGKSTAVKLLCRLYDPVEGRITLDGRPLSAYRVRDVRRLFAVMPQDFMRYQLTAAENIALGDLPGEVTGDTVPEERIRAAAVRSGADHVVSTLRHGYGTVLGRMFEDGEELSAGEWQKIALARVFLSPAQVLVFDEPASWLDANAEREFFDGVRQLAGERTVILISHRFANVKLCDRIYVFDHGRIEEHGTHDELAARGGLYARMYDVQAGSYR